MANNAYLSYSVQRLRLTWSWTVKTPLTTPDILPTLLGLADMPIPKSVEGDDLSETVRHPTVASKTLAEKRPQVAHEEVLCHVAGNDRFIHSQGTRIGAAKLGGDFESDVQELPEVQIVAGTVLIVAQGGNILRR